MPNAFVRLGAVISVLALLFCAPANAQRRAKTPVPPAGVTVVVQTGDIDTVEARIVQDMARALGDTNIRVIPLVGQGAIQGVNDLLQLRYIDAALIQSDVLAHFKATQRIPAIENKLQYIATLFSQEVHVLARMQFTCLADLKGRRVNFGTVTSGAAMTAEAVFSAHDVAVQPDYLHHDAAIRKLKTGEIDAIVFVGAARASAFNAIKNTDKVHFLDVDYVDALQTSYLPGIMTHEDYPDLISRDETVSTISVGSVLTMAGHRSNSEQFRRLASFTDQLFARAGTLKTADYQPKWNEFNLEAPLEGWTRFPAAQAWIDLKTARAPAAKSVNAAAVAASPSATPPAPASGPQPPRPTITEQFLATQSDVDLKKQNELFSKFVDWYEQQKAP